MMFGIKTGPNFWGNMADMTNQLAQNYGGNTFGPMAKAASSTFGKWRANKKEKTSTPSGGMKINPVSTGPKMMPQIPRPTNSGMAGGAVQVPIPNMNARYKTLMGGGIMGGGMERNMMEPNNPIQGMGYSIGSTPNQYPIQQGRGLWDRYNRLPGVSQGQIY
jgi:hypothetical protein